MGTQVNGMYPWEIQSDAHGVLYLRLRSENEPQSNSQASPGICIPEKKGQEKTGAPLLNLRDDLVSTESDRAPGSSGATCLHTCWFKDLSIAFLIKGWEPQAEPHGVECIVPVYTKFKFSM